MNSSSKQESIDIPSIGEQLHRRCAVQRLCSCTLCTMHGHIARLCPYSEMPQRSGCLPLMYAQLLGICPNEGCGALPGLDDSWSHWKPSSVRLQVHGLILCRRQSALIDDDIMVAYKASKALRRYDVAVSVINTVHRRQGASCNSSRIEMTHRTPTPAGSNECELFIRRDVWFCCVGSRGVS